MAYSNVGSDTDIADTKCHQPINDNIDSYCKNSSVKEAFSRLLYQHIDFPALLKEEHELKKYWPFDRINGNSNSMSSLVLRWRSGRCAGGCDPEKHKYSELQQLTDELRHCSEAGLCRRGCLSSIAGLVQALKDQGSKTQLKLEDAALRPLLALPLLDLNELVQLRLTTYGAIVAGLSLSPSTSRDLLSTVISAILASGAASIASAAASQFVSALVSHAYYDPPDTALCLDTTKCKNFAAKLLRIISCKIFNHLLEGNAKKAEDAFVNGSQEDIAGHDSNSCLLAFYAHLLACGSEVSSAAVRQFLSSHLQWGLSLQPSLTLAEALQQQTHYRAAALSPMLRNVLFKVCVGVGVEAALCSLDRVVRHQEVNWQVVLALLSTLLNVHQDAPLKITALIQEYLQSGCRQEEMELCILGLLFARQCCSEGSHVFPRYPHWFSATFGSPGNTPAPGKKEFTFLMQFLTTLVPHEPAACLRTHVTQSLHVPRGCLPLLRDYRQLASARLSDLGDEEVVHGQVLEEVNAAIEQFDQTKKIPKSVLETSIFKKVHYNSVFLPTLLKPRAITNSATRALVDALYEAGRVPPVLYARYQRDLQSDAECGDATASPSPPELRALLDLLTEDAAAETDHTSDQAGENRGMLSVLSRMSVCLEKALQAADAPRLNDVALVLSPSLPTSATAIEILEQLLGTLSSLTLSPCPGARPQWRRRPRCLPQLVALLASSYSLQAALVTYCHQLLDGVVRDTQREVELWALGVLLCEVSQLSGLFLPVLCSGNTRPLALHVLHTLRLHTPLHCWAANQLVHAWLCWHQRCLRVVDTPAEAASPLRAVDVAYWRVRWCLQDVQAGLPQPLLRALRTEQEQDEAMDMEKPGLEEWLLMECGVSANLTVGGVAAEVRRLQRRLVTSYAELTKRQVVETMARLLVDGGVREEMWSVLMLVLQSRASARSGAVSLLSWWQQQTKDRRLEQHLQRFLSLCECVPPAFLLGALTPALAAQALAALISDVQRWSPCLVLPLDVTVTLTAAVLTLRGSHSSQDDLEALWRAVVFHWSAVCWLFEDNFSASGEEQRPAVLLQLWRCLQPPINSVERVKQLCCVSADLAVHHAAGTAVVGTGDGIDAVPAELRPQLVRFLAACVGQRVFCGEMQPLPSNVGKEADDTVNDVLCCLQRVLVALLESRDFDSQKVIFTAANDDVTEYYHVFGFVYSIILMLRLDLISSIVPSDQQLCNRLQILLHCHAVLVKAFESDDNALLERPCKRPKLTSPSTGKETPLDSLDYLTVLSSTIVDVVSTASARCLQLLPDVLLQSSDQQVRATLTRRLASLL